MTKYTIFKNWHYSFFLIKRLFGWYYNKKNFIIYFELSNDCWWATPRNSDDYDLNKLAGISFGGIHKNSIRLTWTPNFQKVNVIRLYGYTYDHSMKEHTSKYLCEIETNKEYACNLKITDNTYILDMSLLGAIGMENKSKDGNIQKITYPYFGGNNKSPNKMDIWMKIKKGY